ncbi:MAG TPA: YbaB/EbfC family nucleoid-associated protein [Alphaproteobacteria bacterium]|nr:YbaB/EbfC family nucleoid-associated protein [Alphaproteobacteria bacterium]
MNLGNMMKQVQEMQAKMAEMQKRLADTEITGTAGGGMVMATTNGKGELKKIKIDPKLADPAEIEMLEDLIVAACTDARKKAEEQMASETEKMMGGLPLPPGMKLPF